MSDIYIKDEGDFCTVILQTGKAEEAAKSLDVEGLKAGKKIDVLNEYMTNIVGWAASHNLTVDSEVTVITQEQKIVPKEEYIKIPHPEYGYVIFSRVTSRQEDILEKINETIDAVKRIPNDSLLGIEIRNIWKHQ